MRLTLTVTANAGRPGDGSEPPRRPPFVSAGESYPGRSSRMDSSVDRHADMSSDTRVDNVKSKRRAAAVISEAAAAPPPVPAPAAAGLPPVIGELIGGAARMGADAGRAGPGPIRRSAGSR